MSFDLCALHPIAIIFVHPQVRGQECLPSSFACPLCLLKWVARSKLFGTGPDWLVNRFWEVHTQLCVCLCISCQANGNSMGKKTLQDNALIVFEIHHLPCWTIESKIFDLYCKSREIPPESFWPSHHIPSPSSSVPQVQPLPKSICMDQSDLSPGMDESWWILASHEHDIQLPHDCLPILNFPYHHHKETTTCFIQYISPLYI